MLLEERPISSTDKPIEKTEENYFLGFSTPRSLTVEEIPDVIKHFTLAAKNALEAGMFTSFKFKWEANNYELKVNHHFIYILKVLPNAWVFYVLDGN